MHSVCSISSVESVLSLSFLLNLFMMKSLIVVVVVSLIFQLVDVQSSAVIDKDCDFRYEIGTCYSLPRRSVFKNISTIFWRSNVVPSRLNVLKRFPNLKRFVCVREMYCQHLLKLNSSSFRLECLCRQGEFIFRFNIKTD